VAGDESVVKVEELPKTWGLLIAKGGKLKTVVEAPAKKAHPVSRIFMMAIIRRVCEAYVPKGQLDALVTAEVAKKIEDAVSNAAFGREHLATELKELQERINVFEAKSGVKIDRWDSEKVGEAVAIVRKHGPAAIIEQYGYLARRMNELGKELAEATDDARAALDTLKV